MGGEVRQYRITPDIAAMQALDVTPEQIEAAVTRFGTHTRGGFIDQQGREYLIRNVGLTQRLEDLRNTVVLQRQGQPILLHQVAGVDFAARVKRGDAGYQGRPAVIIGIQKQPEADTVALTRQVETALAEIQKTLPAGISRDECPVPAGELHRDLDRQCRARAAGGGRRRRRHPAALPDECPRDPDLADGDPVSILTTVLVFQAFGLTINTMTLGGLAIAIGELVDDAVVDVENILRRLKQNRESAAPRPVLAVIAAASQEVRSGIVYATAIIILVFIPLFALSGIEGRLFAPLGIAYIVSILASLIVSITLTPVMAYYLLSGAKSGHERDSFVVRHLKRGNAALLRFAFETRALLVTVVGIGVALAVYGATLCRGPSCRPSTRARWWSRCNTTRASRWPRATASGSSPNSSS